MAADGNSTAGPVARRLIGLLAEGDRRETGRAAEVALEILDNPAMVPDLLIALGDRNETVVSHAAHAAMQLGGAKPALFQPYVDDLIAILQDATAWEAGEQLPKILAEMELEPEQSKKLATVLAELVEGRSAIAAASALSAMARLAERNLIDADTADSAIAQSANSPRKAVAARARLLLANKSRHRA